MILTVYVKADDLQCVPATPHLHCDTPSLTGDSVMLGTSQPIKIPPDIRPADLDFGLDHSRMPASRRASACRSTSSRTGIVFMLSLLALAISADAHADTGADDHRPLFFDVGARGSKTPDGSLMIEPIFEVGRSFVPHLSFNIGLTGGSAPLLSGKRHAFTVLPSVDAFRSYGPVQGYIRAGIGLQSRGGANFDSVKALALFTGVGARVNTRLCIYRRQGQRRKGCMILGTEVRVHKALLGGWLMSRAVLPSGASIVSTGFTLGMEV